LNEVDENSEAGFLPSIEQQNKVSSKSSASLEPIMMPPSFESPIKTNLPSVEIHGQYYIWQA